MTKPKPPAEKPTASPARKSRASGKANAAVDAAKDGLQKRQQGRASKYTTEIVEEILARISIGETLRQICRDEKMPSYGAVYDWLEKDANLASRFARAREKGEEAIAQECLDIADNAKNDWMESVGMDGTEAYKLNGEHIQRSKLRIETRLKLLAKWNPKKWGEKVDLNHGVQPENPLAKLLEQVQGTPLRPKAE